MPEAQLDRFMLSIHVDYPTRTDELTIAVRPLRAAASGLTPVASREVETFTVKLKPWDIRWIEIE